jgi:dipeptidyl aminopeptidase/acylaminoacyl peptidase
MQADVRDTPLWTAISDLYRRLNEPFGEVASAADLSPSPDGTRVAFTGTKRDGVEVDPVSRIYVADLATGTVDELTGGPHDDRLPRWSPDGTTIAFLSDRRHRGRSGLFLLEAGQLGEAWAAPEVDGSVEWLSWSPDGTALLLGVAGTGAEKSGVEGSGAVARDDGDKPAWLPRVTTTDTSTLWRRAWRYDVATRTATRVSRESLNVWEAAWCGPQAIAVVVSDDPGEGTWYDARLAVIDLDTGVESTLHQPKPRRQLGWPAATADGARLAVVEAVCSDRWVVAGDVLLVENGTVSPVDTGGVDVSWLAWRDATTLAFAGERGLDTVIGIVDVTTGAVTTLWAGPASNGVNPTAALLPDGTAAVELSSWDTPARLAVVGPGVDRTVHAFAPGAGVDPASLGTERRVTWAAPDGLEVEGLLYTPSGEPPYATVLYVHGGPVSREHSRAPARQRFHAVLLARGYAVLVPNVRGSSGRGQAYAEMVVGDLGGAETYDHLAGLDHLVATGVADPARLGVVGGSHGGFMTAWLVTQAPERFAAAVALSPVTDWRSQHYTSNIAHFDASFVGALDDPMRDERSPLLHADKVRTPTFLTAGEVDRCTPPGQALEFHQALAERGVPTACAIYPGEGHGVRRFPGAIDWATRVVGWFEEWMPA